MSGVCGIACSFQTVSRGHILDTVPPAKDILAD